MLFSSIVFSSASFLILLEFIFLFSKEEFVSNTNLILVNPLVYASICLVNFMEKSITVRKTVVLEPFIKLVKLVARAFYDDYITEVDNPQKSGRTESKGTAVQVLDTLTRRQWVREDDLARDLKMQTKLIVKLLRYLEGQKLVMRHEKKETAKNTKVYSHAVGATTDGRPVKPQIHSYFCLDYQNMYDIVRLKLNWIKKKLKDELDDKNTVQEYGCPNCKRKYNALDALRLISMEDDCFHCENCNGELVVECDKLTSEEVVDGGENARRRQQEKLKDLLKNLDRLGPLMEQINRVKDLPFPACESFPAWEARAAKAARENGDFNPNDPSRSQGGYGSTPMPFLGETKVEVNLGEGIEDIKSKGGDSSLKVLPPWMIKSGMNLTDEQRGEMRQETKVEDGGSEGAAKLSDDKKSAMGNGNDEDIKDEYAKAYYAALLRKQHELTEKQNQQEGELTPHEIQSVTSTSSDRQVGMKSKREEEDEEDVEWEEEAPPVAANGNYKVDLNVEAEASGREEEEEEEDDIDWEEG